MTLPMPAAVLLEFTVIVLLGILIERGAVCVTSLLFRAARHWLKYYEDRR